MKLVGIAALGIVCFIGAIAFSLHAGGHLNKENMSILLGKEQPAEAAPAETGENVPQTEAGGVKSALTEREEKIFEREKELAQEAERLEKVRAELEVERAEIEKIQKEIQQAIAAENADQPKRIEEVALSLSKMKATNAAKTLQEWSDEEAANILRLMKDRDRGKILDLMEAERAAKVLRALQAPKL